MEELLKRAEEMQLDEDSRVLDDENSKIGEGANTSAHVSSRGYVVKPISYDIGSDNPFEQAEKANEIDRFPWVEMDERDGEGPSNYALVKISKSDLTHEEAFDTFHMSDIVEKDLNMFFDLREDGITYGDLKPKNIGYFLEDDYLIAKPIDVIDRHAWEEEEELDTGRFSRIMDVYIQGTPNEDGLTDLYPITVPEAEEQVMNYLGLETEGITGKPNKDIFQSLDESRESMEDTFSY